MFFQLPGWLVNTLFPINRWLHLVATTLLVGGVLFFEFVVPLATADLKEENQLAVFGRTRWVFRKVAWFSIGCLLLSGGLSLWRMWRTYQADSVEAGGFWVASLPWALGHVALSLCAFWMVLRVTKTRRIYSHPLFWLRATLVVLLISMFGASVARHIRLRLRELHDAEQYQLEPRRSEVNRY